MYYLQDVTKTTYIYTYSLYKECFLRQMFYVFTSCSTQRTLAATIDKIFNIEYKPNLLLAISFLKHMSCLIFMNWKDGVDHSLLNVYIHTFLSCWGDTEFVMNCQNKNGCLALFRQREIAFLCLNHIHVCHCLPR